MDEGVYLVMFDDGSGNTRVAAVFADRDEADAYIAAKSPGLHIYYSVEFWEISHMPVDQEPYEGPLVVRGTEVPVRTETPLLDMIRQLPPRMTVGDYQKVWGTDHIISIEVKEDDDATET